MLNIKTLKKIKLPSKSYAGDAGWDVYSQESYLLAPSEAHKFALGFYIIGEVNKVYITHGRSSLAINHGIDVIGDVIDNGYRGEVSVVLQNNSLNHFKIAKGDKIAQILVQYVLDDNILIADGKTHLIPTKVRGIKGYGSTGKT
jgi:dUTP pyrophosphatase